MRIAKSVPYIYIIWVNFTINWLNLFPIRGYSFNIGIFTRVVCKWQIMLSFGENLITILEKLTILGTKR